MKLYETHIPVSDLERSKKFYSDIVGLELAFEQPHRGVAFLWVGGREQGMLGLWAPDSAYGWKGKERFKSHFAISIPLEKLLEMPIVLQQNGIEVRGFDGTPHLEPSVIGWMPSAQIYFADPDGHSVEFITVLNEALNQISSVDGVNGVNEMVSHTVQSHTKPLSLPKPQRIQVIFTRYWNELETLPPLTHTNENLLAEALTTRLRDLVIEMMLALNGIAYPQNISNLNAYLGDSQREAIEKTLIANTTGPDAWIARAVALTVIYQWYAPQLVDKYDLDYPHELEQQVRAKLIAELPQWPQSITSE